MILDAQNLLSDAQAFTETGVSTNAFDAKLAANGIDIGEPLCVVVGVDVAAVANDNDETYAFEVVSADDAALTSNVTTVTPARSIARASLTAGSRWVLPIAPETITKRYIGLRATLGGTTPGITITAALQPLALVQLDKVYADAITIS